MRPCYLLNQQDAAAGTTVRALLAGRLTCDTASLTASLNLSPYDFHMVPLSNELVRFVQHSL
jgi:hypothetical protein